MIKTRDTLLTVFRCCVELIFPDWNAWCLPKNKCILGYLILYREKTLLMPTWLHLLSFCRFCHRAAPSLWSGWVCLCLHAAVCPQVREMWWTWGLHRWLWWARLSSQTRSSALWRHGVPVLCRPVYPIPPSVWRSAWLSLWRRWIQLWWVIFSSSVHQEINSVLKW